jgi:hypothetical protein
MAEGSSVTIKFVRTVEFGLAMGCVWAAWTVGGDMSLIVPALILGVTLAIIGIGTIPASKPYKLGAVGVVAFIYFGIGWFLHWHFQPKAEAVTTPPPATAPKIAAANGPLISTIGKTFYRCPLPPVPTDRTPEQISSDLKERIQAAQETFGVSMRINELPNGRQIIMEPITAEAQLRMWGATRWTFEMRKSGPDLLITSIIDLAEPIGSLSKLMPIDPKSDQIATENRYIEEMLHIPSGKCQML